MVDFIGIGAARSGTSWISRVLNRHPDIDISEPKEVRYFNRFEIPCGRYKGRLNPNYDRSLEWYLRHFRQGEGLVGEYSPIYLFDEDAPAAIKRRFPDVSLICSLRNPVDRAYSHYWIYKGAGLLDMSFEETFAAEPVFVNMGFYVRQLRRYLEYFDRQRMHILVFDDLVSDPGAEILRMLRFLGVRDDVPLDFSRESRNEPVKVRFPRFHLFARATSRMLSASGFAPVLRGLRKVGLQGLVQRLSASRMGYPPMNPDTRRQLIATYADDIAALERLLDRDLSAWTRMPGEPHRQCPAPQRSINTRSV